MNKLKYICLISIVFFACSKKENQVNIGSDFLPWNYSDNQISSFFDSVEYIPIEPHPEGLFKKADKLIIHNNKFFIFDYQGQNQVNVFDQKGSFLYKIGKKGRGPGEYVEIRNFTIKDNLIYLIDNRLNKLLIYDVEDGKFREDKILPFYAHDMIVGDNGDYVFAQQKIHGEKPAKFQRYNIFITNPDFDIKHSLFPFREEDCGIRSQLCYFSETENHIVFRTMVSDSIILLDRKLPSNIYSTYHIDFGAKSTPRKYENDDEALKEYSYLYSTPNITQKYMTGNFWIGKNYGYDPYIYFFEKNEAVIKNDNNTQFFFSPLLCVKDTIYSLYDHAYFDLWTKGNTIPEIPENIIQHLSNGDDVLIKYTIK